MNNLVLKIENLHVSFNNEGTYTSALKGITIEVKEARCTGIVGESGSGKSITFAAAIGLLNPKGRIDKGTFTFIKDGKEQYFGAENAVCPWQGKGVSIIFQEPLTALNPTMKCGRQVEENLKENSGKSQVLEWFNKVKLDNPEKVYNSYPHEVSGGQRQRVMIAMALASEPTLLIADEPTTALDPKVQDEVLSLLKTICSESNIALVLISHDLEAIESFADDVYVFNKGEVVEGNTADLLFKNPKEPYTKALLASKKAFSNSAYTLPAMEDLLLGKFETQERPKNSIQEEILSAEDLSKMYTPEVGLRPTSLNLRKGEVLAIAGRSGSGKSTFAKLLMQIEKKDGGLIKINGEDVMRNSKRFRWIQMVFQDPYSSLHPSKRVIDALTEVIVVHQLAKSKKLAKQRAAELLETVGIDQDQYNKFPHQFSGGQRQRVSIARALAVEPEVMVMDEAVAALDLSIQAKIINLLVDLQQKFQLSFIFITHDIHVIEYFADRVALLHNGELIDIGDKEKMLPILKKQFKSEINK